MLFILMIISKNGIDWSYLTKLFPKGEDFWKELIDTKPDINHDVTHWFGNK